LRLLGRLLLVGVLGAFALGGYVWLGLPGRGDVHALAASNPGTTGVMRQREGEARAAGRPFRRIQSWVPISRMSRHLVHAVLSSEDQKFFGHQGVDWDAIEKSVQEDRKERRFARGGSTITQQLAKNLYFTTHKSLVRKVRELIVARWLEEDLSKRRILELYLNVIEWGDGVYGAEAAAQRYFGKPASALDADEAAGLAAMIPNPRRINPRVDGGRFARAQRRVVWLMAHAGYLSRSGLGAEPPPEPVEEDEPAPPETPQEPIPSGPASPADLASPAEPVVPATPEPTPSPV
jgi:monofunctional glycosyltransferase